MPPNERAMTSVDVPATRLRYDGEPASLVRAVAVEAPVNIVYAPLPYAVMMATPADLEDFAVGFSLTEGVVAAPSDIRDIAIEYEARGIRLVVTLAAGPMQRHLARSRNMAGRTGCGVCGIDDLTALPFATSSGGKAPVLSVGALRRAMAALGSRQPLNDLTRAVHAAAWCDAAGAILHVREDVGRHNALDKLIGALARAEIATEGGFIAITSRCSFEMVEKAAVFGARAVVAVSAPTSLAIERAQVHAMVLVAVARDDGALVFTETAAVRADAVAGEVGLS
jgi:FdhD protein